MTKYVVLQENGKGEWAKLEFTIEATSAKAAVRAHLAEAGASEERVETYVAIPARSWQPVKVAVETALKFS